MSIVFYYAPMSSASPVVWALAELGVQHQAVKLDLAAGDTRKPDFLAINPNGKVPTLVVDGTPVFEAVAIMQWLGDRYGVEKGLWPAPNDPARLQAVSWSCWAYVSFGGALSRLFMSQGLRLGKDAKNDVQHEYCRKEIAELLGVLDGRLAAKGFVLGDKFSLVDLIVGGATGYANMSGVSLDGHPNVKKWLEKCQARPAFKAAMGG